MDRLHSVQHPRRGAQGKAEVSRRSLQPEPRPRRWRRKSTRSIRVSHRRHCDEIRLRSAPCTKGNGEKAAGLRFPQRARLRSHCTTAFFGCVHQLAMRPTRTATKHWPLPLFWLAVRLAVNTLSASSIHNSSHFKAQKHTLPWRDFSSERCGTMGERGGVRI